MNTPDAIKALRLAIAEPDLDFNASLKLAATIALQQLGIVPAMVYPEPRALPTDFRNNIPI